MKKFTKLLSLLLAVLMAASLATAAFADGHPSVVRVQISGDVGSMAPWAPDGNGRTNAFGKRHARYSERFAFPRCRSFRTARRGYSHCGYTPVFLKRSQCSAYIDLRKIRSRFLHRPFSVGYMRLVRNDLLFLCRIFRLGRH